LEGLNGIPKYEEPLNPQRFKFDPGKD